MPQTATPLRRMFGEADSAAENLSDSDYELASRILDALGERVDGDWSPSEIAKMRGVRAGDVHAVHRALAALVEDAHVSSTDRGAWSRYRFIWG